MYAPEPPNRWRRSRCLRRRAARFPPHSNGVGAAFQCRATAANHPMISDTIVGCCPSNARRFKIRWMLSAMFSHEPPTGVYNGMMP